MEVAGWFGGPIVQRLIDAGFDYLKDQVGWETHVKEKLERLQIILPNIQAVVDFASRQIEISDQLHLNKWLWQLRDAIDEADDVLDDFEYIKHQQQLMTKNSKRKKVPSNIVSSMKKRLVNLGKPALESDTIFNRLEKVVNKLYEVSARVDKFIYLLQNTKQEQQQQQLELYKSRETGPLPKTDIIGRGNDKEFVMRWLMSKPSNQEGQSTTRYKNISLLSIVGHGGMGKTTLLQHVYEDVRKEEFPLKMWVCVSTNFDPKKVIADMLEYVTEGRPDVEALGKLQENLKSKFEHILESQDIFLPFYQGLDGTPIQQAVNKYEQLCIDLRQKVHIADTRYQDFDEGGTSSSQYEDTVPSTYTEEAGPSTFVGMSGPTIGVDVPTSSQQWVDPELTLLAGHLPTHMDLWPQQGVDWRGTEGGQYAEIDTTFGLSSTPYDLPPAEQSFSAHAAHTQEYLSLLSSPNAPEPTPAQETQDDPHVTVEHHLRDRPRRGPDHYTPGTDAIPRRRRKRRD